MTRQEWLKQLERELRKLPHEEVADALDYYNEYFDEAGAENEQWVINELGDPKKIAKQIISDVAAKNLDQQFYGDEEGRTRYGKIPKKDKEPKDHTVRNILIAVGAGILALPIAAPLVGILLFAAGIILFGLIAVFIGVLGCAIAALVTGACGIVYGIAQAGAGSGGALIVVGGGILLVGLAILAGLAVVKGIKGIIILIGKAIARGRRKKLEKKGKNAPADTVNEMPVEPTVEPAAPEAEPVIFQLEEGEEYDITEEVNDDEN